MEIRYNYKDTFLLFHAILFIHLYMWQFKENEKMNKIYLEIYLENSSTS